MVSGSKIRTVEFGAGEVIDGTVAIPGVYTTVVENFVINDQKQPTLRKANNVFISMEADIIDQLSDNKLNSYESIQRQQLFTATLQPDGLTVSIAVTPLGDYPPGSDDGIVVFDLVSTTPVKMVFFTEMEANYLTLNTVIGATGILLTGLSDVWLISGGTGLNPTITTSIFKITNYANPTTPIAITGASDCGITQNQLFFSCKSPNLSAGTPPNVVRIIGSIANKFDVFNIEGELLPVDLPLSNAGDEEIYAMACIESFIFLTTNKGLRVVKSSSDDDHFIDDTALTYLISTSECIRARPIRFGGFVIFACRRYLAGKVLAGMDSSSDRSDFSLPTLAKVRSDIINIDTDSSNRNVLIFMENGNVSTISSQSIFANKTYNITLPTSQGYVVPHKIWAINNNWITTFNKNYDGTNAIIVSRETDPSPYGYLLDAASGFSWLVTVTNPTTNSFVPVNSYNFDQTYCTGLILLVEDEYIYFATDSTNNPKYTTPYTNVDMTLYDGQVLEAWFISYSMAYITLPNGYRWQYSVVGIRYDLIGGDDLEKYVCDDFYNAPVNNINSFNQLPANQAYYGTINMYIALASPSAKIGYRGLGDIDVLLNSGGGMTVLLSSDVEFNDYMQFYTDNGCVRQYLNPSRSTFEVVFQDSVGQGYSDETITLSAKTFLKSMGDLRVDRIVI